ncbi:MAG: polysaccharide deacetylase family protein [Pseudomonadota bacterium]
MTAAELTGELYQPSRTLPARLRRRMTQWRTVKPLPASPQRAIVSFTFDDFPRSAAEYGADILGRFGARGCYYTCTGYVGQDGPEGPYYREDDIVALSEAGHEIAAHTVAHMDCAATSTGRVMGDISHNLDQLRALGAPGPVTQFAYPYGETSTALKEALTDRFTACRGVLAGVNRKGNDAMQLRAIELGADDASIARAEAAIEAAARSPAWVIFFTHGVSASPSPFGTTPSALTRIVRKARDAGAHLTTPSAAMAEISPAEVGQDQRPIR